MDLNKVKAVLLPFLEQNHYELYDLVITKSGSEPVLQVLVDKEGGIGLEDLTIINNYLSRQLDELETFDEEYLLEVSSPGAERELRNYDEVIKAVGQYVYVKLMNDEYVGTLLSCEEEILTVRVNLKGRFKNFQIKYADIFKIRLAIKF